MLYELWNIVAPVFVCTIIGYFWARSSTPFSADFVSRIVMNIGAPCLVISTINGVEISGQDFYAVALAAILIFLGTSIVGMLAIKMTGETVHSLLPTVVFPNNGNMGLPLCLFAFGKEGLALALAFFLVQMTALMSGGVALMTRNNNGFFGALKDLAVLPLIHSVIVAIFLLGTGLQLPIWIDSTLSILGGLTIPLMLITLGASLTSLNTSVWQRSMIFSLLRIGGGFLFACLVVNLTGLSGVARNVVLLQAIMPAAVFNYLLALKFDRDPNKVASVVITSTLLSLLAIPILLFFLL
ncbi:MAG: transporter [Porticoccus sp.]|mgnify:FL=1|jgi:predicted permease|nr:transporter [Porticoccus sp.]